MEILRQGDDHLEIILNTLSENEQKAEIDALDTVLKNWSDKCQTAKSCTICLSDTVAENQSISSLAEEKATALNTAHTFSVNFDSKTHPHSEDEDIERVEEKKSHIKDLINLAVIDGQFDEEEQKFIVDVGTKLGLSEARVKSLYNECVLYPDQIESAPPQSEAVRMEQLTNLCRLILADGRIDDWESVLIFPLAVKMGFDARDVSKKLNELIEENQS